MQLRKKYIRGTIHHVANVLNMSYSGARQLLLNDSLKAKKIAIEYEKQTLADTMKEIESLQRKEAEVIEMKKNLGKSAV